MIENTVTFDLICCHIEQNKIKISVLLIFKCYWDYDQQLPLKSIDINNARSKEEDSLINMQDLHGRLQ